MSDKVELGLQKLLEAPIEQHFEPLDEFTTYRLAAQAVKASNAPAHDTQAQPARAHLSQGLMAAAIALIMGGVISVSALALMSRGEPGAQATQVAVAITPTTMTPRIDNALTPLATLPRQAAPAANAAVTTHQPLEPIIEAAPTPAKPKRSATKPTAAPDESAATPQRDVTWWIERAGTFELEQDWAQAELAYKAAIAAKPEPTTLSFAHVALGNIYQRHLHKPDEALKHYEGYLSHARRGALAQEALLGSIWALNTLNRPLDEARQIKRLLKEHPQTPGAANLKARLQEIYAPPLK